VLGKYNSILIYRITGVEIVKLNDLNDRVFDYARSKIRILYFVAKTTFYCDKI